MRHPNPYESVCTIADGDTGSGQYRYILSRTSLFWCMLVPLTGVTAWAIVRVSYVGAFLPAAIGLVMALWFNSTHRRTLLAIALASVIGVSAIVIAGSATLSIYGSMQLNEDVWREKVTQAWAACGILGAFAGAAIAVRIGRSKVAPDSTEP